ncbi:MAG: M48 family metalloprotease [Candidatus Bathyarchaeota archaeon]|nr:M48 family metalloprotease [Candidatus Bathyarchaeota archaeon]
MYIDRVDADLKRKISYFAYLPCGIALIILSSFFVYTMFYREKVLESLGLGDIIVLSFLLFLLYGVGFLMLYIFLRHGYPTSYILDDEGVRILFHHRQLAFVPHDIIERVTLDEEGPSVGRIMIGLGSISDMTARRSKQYVAVETPFFTYYLSPSNPGEFKSQLDPYVRGTAFNEEDLMKARSEVESSRMLSLKRLLLLLFVKIPIGQLYVSFFIIWTMTPLGYPEELIYLLSTSFLIASHFVIYLFSSSIASQLLGSNPFSSRKVESAATSIVKKTGGLPKIEVADPLVKGLNAFAAGPSPSKSVVILTEKIEELTADEIEAVILHELYHIKHWHSLKLTATNVVYLTLMYFFGFFRFSTVNLMCSIFLSLLTISLVSKILVREADISSARIVGSPTFSSTLLKIGEDAAFRMYILGLTLGKPKPLEEIKEATGVKRPKRMLKRLSLWIFSLHPPIYHRIETVNNYNYGRSRL